MKPTFPLLLLGLSGCVIGSDKYPRPRDLASVTIVDNLRLLAVVADPPEARPGEQVSFSALIADPNGENPLVAWLACPPDEAGSLGCAVDLSAISPDATPDELAALGVIGFEPGLPPTYVPDATLLDALDPAAREEGIQITIEVAAFPAAILAANPDEIDFADVETGYKRLIVSEALTPNHNPVIDGFTVDGVPVPDGATAELDPDQLYELGITIPDAAIEAYEYTNSAGIAEERTEEPYADWYCTGGNVKEFNTLYPYTQSDYITSTEPGDVTCWIVVRDRRGGMAWRMQKLVVR